MQLSEVVALAYARPWSGQDWAGPILERFPDSLRRAVDRWGLSIERAHLDGVGLPVLEVRRGGEPAAVKFDDAGTDLEQQVRVMSAADGRGYCRVLDHDLEIGAALLERLGPSLATTTPEGLAQVDVLTGLLEQAWDLPLSVAQDEEPGEKAHHLLALITTELAESGWTERHTLVLDRAEQLANALAADPSLDRVVAHGDAHSLNVLQRPATDGYAFIDPDGFLCEREYDAGVVLRDLMNELEQQGPGRARRWHEEQVDRVSDRLGLDPDRVGAWSFTERCTTGIWLHRLGYADEGERWLRSAALLLR